MNKNKTKQKTGREQLDESYQPAFRFSDKGPIPSIKKMKRTENCGKRGQNTNIAQMNKIVCRRCGEMSERGVWSHCPECGYAYDLPLDERPDEWWRDMDETETEEAGQ